MANTPSIAGFPSFVISSLVTELCNDTSAIKFSIVLNEPVHLSVKRYMWVKYISCGIAEEIGVDLQRTRIRTSPLEESCGIFCATYSVVHEELWVSSSWERGIYVGLAFGMTIPLGFLSICEGSYALVENSST